MLKHENDLQFQDAVFSPEGNRLVSVGNKGVVYLWDVSQTYPVSYKQVHEGTAFACAYSKDGKYIVTGGEEKSIKILKANDLSLVKTIDGLPAQVREIAMTGNRLVVLLQNSEIQIYTTDSWTKVGKPKYAAKDAKILFNHKGDRFYTWFSSRISVYSAKDGQLLKVFKTNYATPTDLALSKDDKYLVVGFGQANEIMRIYNASDFKHIKSVKKSGAGDYASGISFLHNSNKVLYQSNAGIPNLKIYDLEKDRHTTLSRGNAAERTSISKDDSTVLLTPKASNSIQLMSLM
ncbi:WD40 repeat domain-containing protein [Rufibacter sp. XAAS-G3-1]|uniref:WD40 repeat domain-containing protein n=1 Tax=Rufibacter sp. XAAS-G3-1 TaxID=2729134 RepID=UPI0015E63D2A|nr:hypothetical protein [Rufibacter sp. XAAS-G3-1]